MQPAVMAIPGIPPALPGVYPGPYAYSLSPRRSSGKKDPMKDYMMYQNSSMQSMLMQQLLNKGENGGGRSSSFEIGDLLRVLPSMAMNQQQSSSPTFDQSTSSKGRTIHHHYYQTGNGNGNNGNGNPYGNGAGGWPYGSGLPPIGNGFGLGGFMGPGLGGPGGMNFSYNSLYGRGGPGDGYPYDDDDGMYDDEPPRRPVRAVKKVVRPAIADTSANVNDNVRKLRTKLPPPPFPGPWPLRKVRHIAFMVWFTRILKKLMDDKLGIQHDFIEVGELKTPAPGQKAPPAKAAPKAAAPAKKSVQIVEDDDGYYDDGYDDGYYDDDYYDDDYYSPRPARAPAPRSRNTIGGIVQAMRWPRGNRGAPPPRRAPPRVVVDNYDQDNVYNEPVPSRVAKTQAAPVYRPPPGSITGRSAASRNVVDDEGATYGSDPRRRKPPIITPAPAENVYTQNRNNNYPPEKRVGEYTEYVDDRRGLLPNASVSESFLTGIHLKECVSALHNIYTNPNGRIANILQRATSDAANDFKLALLENKGAQREAIYKDLDFIIEKLTFEITELMPKTGVLGTHKKAFAYSLVQPGRTFPSTYFWSVEKRLLNLDRSGRTVTCTDFHALVLLSGIYIGRALVSTCFFRPMEYGLTDSQPTARVESNLRILSSIFIYIWRKVLSDQYAVNPVEIPLEIGKFVFNDEIMAPMYERLKNNIIYAENLIREWGKEYIRRLRTAK